jgi:micrococcal nuclease
MAPNRTSLLKSLFGSRQRFSKRRWVMLAIVAVILFIPEQWLGPLAGFIKGNSSTSQQSQTPTVDAPISLPSVEADKTITLTPETRLQCTVHYIIDGDTIACDINKDGKIQKPNENIRFLQVDTPETKRSSRNPTGEPQPFGLEAKALTERLVRGKAVTLVLDKKPRDRYGRTLAFVYPKETSKQSVNERLLEEGLAKVMIYGPNYKLRDEVKALEVAAKQKERGVWSGGAS